jgi:hypothetical protein
VSFEEQSLKVLFFKEKAHLEFLIESMGIKFFFLCAKDKELGVISKT